MLEVSKQMLNCLTTWKEKYKLQSSLKSPPHSPSPKKASQFCFYISHKQGKTIPTSHESQCAHLHHQPYHNITKT